MPDKIIGAHFFIANEGLTWAGLFGRIAALLKS
jgi:hypothetical protein